MPCFSTKNVRAERIGMLGQSVYRANGLLSDTEPNPLSVVEYGLDVRCLSAYHSLLSETISVIPANLVRIA